MYFICNKINCSGKKTNINVFRSRVFKNDPVATLAFFFWYYLVFIYFIARFSFKNTIKVNKLTKIVSISDWTLVSSSSGMKGLMITSMGTLCTSSLYALWILVILPATNGTNNRQYLKYILQYISCLNSRLSYMETIWELWIFVIHYHLL